MQPKKVVVDENRRYCPICGKAEARMVRKDNYLSLFFIPLFPISRGEPYLECPNCGLVEQRAGIFDYDRLEPPKDAPSHCRFCGRGLEGDFVFCPQCGHRI